MSVMRGVSGVCGVVRVWQVWSRGKRVFSRQPRTLHQPHPSPAALAQVSIDQYEQVPLGPHETSGVVPKAKEKNKKKNGAEATEGESEHLKAPTDPLTREIQYKNYKSSQHHIRQLLSESKSQKYRREQGVFVVEGTRIIREALQAGLTPQAIFFTRLSQLVRLRLGGDRLGLGDLQVLNDLPLYRTPYHTLSTWSSLTTCPGIVGIFKTTEPGMTVQREESVPLTLVLDEIREPGNMGAILRSAASVGAARVVLMKGCCDPWESKVLRAGSGAHFRLSLVPRVTWDVLANYMPHDTALLLADMSEDGHLEDELEQELEGVSTTKPQPRKKKDDSYDDGDGVYIEVDDQGNKVVVDTSYTNEELLREFKGFTPPSYYYDQLHRHVDLTGSVVLVVGGETGLSRAARMFACDHCGVQVAVPMGNGMNSLNSSVATGIILYELRKHLCQLNKEMCKEAGAP